MSSQQRIKRNLCYMLGHAVPPLVAKMLSRSLRRNMSNAGAPDSSIVKRLKNLLTEYGTELLKPCDPTEELLRKLDRLEYVLLHTLQEHEKFVEMFLHPSKEALIADELVRHSEFDVRVSAASCISQIIRITAPDESYEEGHMTVRPVEESRGKTSVSEGLNEDIMKSSPQCRLLHSKDEAPSRRVSKHNPKQSLSHLRKPTISNWGRGAIGIKLKTSWSSSIIHMIPPLEFTRRCASRVVGKEVVGRRIKIWWPLDKKFYGGKILCFDDKYKLHQIDYDDGEMEFLYLRGECWKLLKDGNSPAHKQDWFGTAPASSSGTK